MGMLERNDLYIGYKLIEDIHSPNHGLLLKKGSVLTHKEVRRLSRFNISISSYMDVLQEPRQAFYDHVNKQVNQFKSDFDRFGEDQSRLKIVESDMIPTLTKLANDIDIQMLMLSMKSHDDYTYRHNIAVSMLAAKLATWLGYSDSEVNRIAFCGLLHDIGKTRIPTEILNKADKLTKNEFAIMKHHTTFGYTMLREQGFEEDLLRVALEHHEREDGSGYPAGKKSDDIHPYAKLIAIVDCFHAMTSDRSYRHALSFYEALIQLQTDAFGKLDPKKTMTFIYYIMQSSIGSFVELSDGRQGVIKFIPIETPIFPYIEVEGDIVTTATSNLFINKFTDPKEIEAAEKVEWRGIKK
jgi:putative nucleotidyltransferase with HDIG domain